jgi:hypothetical protein
MNFTNKELEHLSNEINHKIKYDGYEFIWLANKGKGFEVHSIIKSKSAKKILSFIKYWIPKYKKELNERLFSSTTRDLLAEAELDVFIYTTIESNYKTSKKIEMIIEAKPNTTPKELIKLGLPKKSVYRYFSNM